MKTAGELPKAGWKKNHWKCQNPKCPNGHRIAITIFRGSGYCSDNCRKALGLDSTPQTRH